MARATSARSRGTKSWPAFLTRSLIGSAEPSRQQPRMSGISKLLLALVAAGILIYADVCGYIGGGRKAEQTKATAPTAGSRSSAPSSTADRSWGHPATLPDHF